MTTPRLLVSIAQSAPGKRKLLGALLTTALLAGMSVAALHGTQEAVAFDNTYTVVAGDTLNAIAINLGIADDDLEAWVDQVVVLNDLPDADTIVEGQTLTLPIGSESSTDDAATNTGSLTPLAEPETYTVQDGDTLLSIAVNLDVADEMAWVDEVVDLNGLESADVIAIAQVLQLPDGTPSASSQADSASSTETSDAETTSDEAPDTAEAALADDSLDDANTYVVDTENLNLFDLATSLGIPDSDVNAWVEAIVALNSLDANGLYVGDVIQLPQPGDY